MSRRTLLRTLGAFVLAGFTGGSGGRAWARGGRGGRQGSPDLEIPTAAYVGHADSTTGVTVYSIPPEESPWTLIQTITDLGVPSSMCLDFLQGALYVAHGDEGQVTAFSVDPATGELTRLSDRATGGRGPAVIALNPTNFFLLAAHAGSGTVTVLPVQADGTLGAPRDVLEVSATALAKRGNVEEGSLTLAFGPRGQLVVSSAGHDKPVVCRLDPLFGKLSVADPAGLPTAAGSAPTRLVFHPLEPYAFGLIAPTSSVAVYALGPERLTLLQVVPAVPSGFTGANTGTDLAIAPSGQFLYVANRGHDSLASFAIDPSGGRLSARGWTAVPGKGPCCLRLERNGTELYVAAEESDALVAFRIDPLTGGPTNLHPLVRTARPRVFVCKDRHFPEGGGRLRTPAGFGRPRTR